MADVLRIDALDEARRIVRTGALLDAAPVLHALLAELERLRAIEAAARALCAAEAAYAGVGEGTHVEPELVLIGRIHETQAALRVALAKGGAK